MIKYYKQRGQKIKVCKVWQYATSCLCISHVYIWGIVKAVCFGQIRASPIVFQGDVENLLLCLVLLFGSSFPLFKLFLPLMKYGMGIRCTKALSVSMFCSSVWVGGWPPAQGSQIVFWGIVRVSFWYRFFPVTFQKKLSANTYHYSNPCIKQK